MKTTLRLAVTISAGLFCAHLTTPTSAAETQTVASFQKTITKTIASVIESGFHRHRYTRKICRICSQFCFHLIHNV